MYTSIFRGIPLILPIIFAGQAALAQADPSALDEAKRRLACGAGTPVSASYLPDGALQVTCQAAGAQSISGVTGQALPATGLSAGAAAGAITGLLFIAVVASDSDSAGTTTSSTSAD
ncbi:hypothetical protein [Leisingera sp. JC1]|uniref:hypothetical protein n=1 Tax=Leisingera sp. JC1 TaxID=1855282 RepID=UPI000807E16E|nr:hypothetical protein [Leisingera sp. JC1]OBY24464.1 hypothetical protein A9D60_08980 [Leisingera sp. JC1]